MNQVPHPFLLNMYPLFWSWTEYRVADIKDEKWIVLFSRSPVLSLFVSQEAWESIFIGKEDDKFLVHINSNRKISIEKCHGMDETSLSLIRGHGFASSLLKIRNPRKEVVLLLIRFMQYNNNNKKTHYNPTSRVWGGQSVSRPYP